MTATTTARLRLTRVLGTAFDVAEDDLAGDVTLTDLGLDSLAVVELVDQLAADLGSALADDTLHPAMTYAYGTVADYHSVITDTGTPEGELAAMRDLGAPVETVEPEEPAL